MKTRIENENEFNKTIDQFGDALAVIAAKKAESDLLKQMLEAYANEHGVLRQLTESYEFAMRKGKPALRRDAGVKEDDVIALLRKSSDGDTYLVTTYDSAALKRDFGGTAAGREKLADFGLILTEPERHAEVKRVGGSRE